jgi:hypothetical protein
MLCYEFSSIFTTTDVLTLIYFAYFQSITYGVIFGGNSMDRKRVFTTQKKVIRIMAGAK